MSDFLKNHCLFSDVPHTDLEAFTKYFKRLKISKSEILFSLGQSPEFIYLIEEGWVKIVRTTEQGDEAMIALYQRNDLLGDERFLSNESYHATAKTISESVVHRLSWHDFQKLRTQNIHFIHNLLSLFAKSHQSSLTEIEHRHLQTAPQRIGCFLLRLCYPQTSGTARISLPYDKYHIAHQLGMQAETFSRGVKKLCESVPIHFIHHNVTINDIAALSHFVCNACSSHYPCTEL